MRELAAHSISVERGKQKVLQAVSLTVRPGELWMVLGPNGAGKSTLLRALAGLLPVAAGTVALDGRSLSQWPRQELAKSVAWLPQTAAPSFGFTGLELVLLGRSPHLTSWGVPSRADVARAQAALEAVGAQGLASRDITQLSGGERQLLSLARAMVQDASFLLLDEPTAHLDLRHQVRVLENVRRLVREGRAAVVISHDLNLAAGFADCALLMQNGTTAAVGAAKDVLTKSTFERVFEVPMRATVVDEQPLFGPELRK